MRDAVLDPPVRDAVKSVFEGMDLETEFERLYAHLEEQVVALPASGDEEAQSAN